MVEWLDKRMVGTYVMAASPCQAAGLLNGQQPDKNLPFHSIP